MDWKSFEIGSTVVHYVPTTKDTPDPAVLLTTAVIDLDSELTDYFADKVSKRLEGKGLEVVKDPDVDSTGADAIASIVASANQLVPQSQVLAQRLFDVQDGNNSSGLLAVLTGRIGSKNCVAILKLERQRGVSFQINPSNGTVDLELLRNLTLTDKTKVYKTALFVAGAGGQTLAGFVADDQRTSASGTQVGDFFLSEFLGCKPKEPAAIVTYRFVKAANLAINRDVASPEVRGRYQVAVLAKMQDNTKDICPEKFAKDNLDAADRSAFLARVEAAGIDPKLTFPKDTSRVKVDEFKMTFDSGMVLVGPPQALQNNVGIPTNPSATRPVELRDSVQSVITGR